MGHVHEPKIEDDKPDIVYELELERVVKEIKKAKARTVCLQLPDGLKPKAKGIVDFIEHHAGCCIVLWAGSCFGACDIPALEKIGHNKIDLVVQFGHSNWKGQGW